MDYERANRGNGGRSAVSATELPDPVPQDKNPGRPNRGAYYHGPLAPPSPALSAGPQPSEPRLGYGALPPRKSFTLAKKPSDSG